MFQWSVAAAVVVMGALSWASISRAPVDPVAPARSDDAAGTRDSMAVDWIAHARACDGDSPAKSNVGPPVGRLPSAGQNTTVINASLRKCDCLDLSSLTKDLENARKLRDRFLSEEEKLRNEFPAPLSLSEISSSQAAFKQFAEQEAPEGIESAPGYVGPDKIDYTPQDIGSDNLSKHTPADQCTRSLGSQQALNSAMEGSVCKGMADAIRAHEDYHQTSCVQAGGQTPYFAKSGADRADEEAHAYEVQAEVLLKAIEAVHVDPIKCILMGDHRAP
jgi:hypothetical protein